MVYFGTASSFEKSRQYWIVIQLAYTQVNVKRAGFEIKQGFRFSLICEPFFPFTLSFQGNFRQPATIGSI
jgi:hypothetical protein